MPSNGTNSEAVETYPMSQQSKCNITVGRIPIQVRYAEVDRQNAVHHSRYAVYFEMGRTELLRDNGYDYRDLEAAGVFLVVARYQCRFYHPARYDDLLELQTSLVRSNKAKLEHDYQLTRSADGKLIAKASTTLVHVNAAGKLQPVPDFLVPEA
ncbi:MAG: acyl-CoA thioesterase [Sedimentisphaerales bacterium]|nr:acyl-CoA thioesterase [Sedimentisphaerales bacterium]